MSIVNENTQNLNILINLITTSDTNIDLKENVLLISDIQQKVILPYHKTELENILLNDNKFNNLQEIIDKKYFLL